MSARIVLASVAALFVAAKLFTAEVSLRDDPTSMLVLRRAPSLESRFHELPDGAVVLAADENGFVGEDAWRWITGIGWIVVPAAALAVMAGARLRRGGAR